VVQLASKFVAAAFNRLNGSRKSAGFILFAILFSYSLWLVGIVFGMLVQATIHGHTAFSWLANHTLFTADSGWYYIIAKQGYAVQRFTASKPYDWVFFPLYPYLVKILSLLFDITIRHSGYIVSWLSFAACFPVLWMWAKENFDENIARWSVIFLAINPCLPYFLAFRAASFFLLLSILSIWMSSRSAWGRASLWGAVANSTRPTGFLLAIPYLVNIWWGKREPGRKVVPTLLGGLFFLGFVIVALIDKTVTGNPLAFSADQAAWSRSIRPPLWPVIKWIAHPSLGLGTWNFNPYAVVMAVAGIGLGVFLLRSGRQWRASGMFLLLAALFATSFNTLQAIPRFIMEIPAWYVALALVATKKPKTAPWLVAACAAITFGIILLWTIGVFAVQP